MLAEIEDALVAAIKQSAIANKLKQIDTLPDQDGDTLVNKFASDAPAVYVSPAAVLNISSGIVTLGFSVVCAVKNAAGHAASRKGDGKAIGVYQIAEFISGLLDGCVAADVPVYVTGINLVNSEVLYKNGLYVAVVTVTGQATIPSIIDFAALDDFETFSAQYDLPPHVNATEHNKWLQEPANYSTSKPELADQLTLPT